MNITEPRFAQNPEHSEMQHVFSLPILPVLIFIHSSIFPTGFILPNLKALALRNYQQCTRILKWIVIFWLLWKDHKLNLTLSPYIKLSCCFPFWSNLQLVVVISWALFHLDLSVVSIKSQAFLQEKCNMHINPACHFLQKAEYFIISPMTKPEWLQQCSLRDQAPQTLHFLG